MAGSMPPGVREARALALSAGGVRNAGAVAELLGNGADWDRFGACAERENAFPVVWRGLSPDLKQRIPAPLAEQFRRRALVAEFTLRQLERLLLEALDALEAAGIGVVLLKGAAMVGTTYGSCIERPMGDIDLLVPPEHAEEARRQLGSLGWTWERSAALDEFYRGHQHLAPMYHPASPAISLEVHTRLFFEGSPFLLGGDEVRAQRRAVRVAGRDAWAPSPEHLLIHLSLHFAWGNFASSGAWKTFRDVQSLVDGALVDWGSVVRLAGAIRARTAVYWTLRLARRLARLQVPDAVFASLRPEASEWTLEIVERHFATVLLTPERECPSSRLRRALWTLGLRPGQSGHGAVRPWTRDGMYKAAATTGGGGPPIGRDDGASRHTSRAWFDYLSALMGELPAG